MFVLAVIVVIVLLLAMAIFRPMKRLKYGSSSKSQPIVQLPNQIPHVYTGRNNPVFPVYENATVTAELRRLQMEPIASVTEPEYTSSQYSRGHVEKNKTRISGSSSWLTTAFDD